MSLQAYFGDATKQKIERVIGAEAYNYVDKYFLSLDARIDKMPLEFFEQEVDPFNQFYTKGTVDECISYLYDYIKKFGYLLPKQYNNVIAHLDKLEPESYL